MNLPQHGDHVSASTPTGPITGRYLLDAGTRHIGPQRLVCATTRIQDGRLVIHGWQHGERTTWTLDPNGAS